MKFIKINAYSTIFFKDSDITAVGWALMKGIYLCVLPKFKIS